MNKDFRTVFKKAVLASLLASTQHGKLGRHNTDSSVSLEVRGRANYVWVTQRDQTAIEALNKAGVPLQADYPVEYREENGRYVILGKSGHPSQENVGEESVGHILGSHADTVFEDLEDGHVPIWDATLGKWINGPPAGGMGPIRYLQGWSSMSLTQGTDVADAVSFYDGFVPESGDIVVFLIYGTAAALTIDTGATPSFQEAIAEVTATSTSNAVLARAIRFTGTDLALPDITFTWSGEAYVIRLFRGCHGSGVVGEQVGETYGSAVADAETTVLASIGTLAICTLAETDVGWYVIGCGRSSSDGVNVAAESTVVYPFDGTAINSPLHDFGRTFRTYGDRGYVGAPNLDDPDWGLLFPFGASMTTYPVVDGTNCCMALIGLKPEA